MKKNIILIITLLISLFIIFLLAISLGSVHIPVNEIINSIIGKNPNTANKYIITRMRLPRTIGAIIIGAGLACSGLIFQSVFKNPMADSYMLGISSSASFMVCLALILIKNINSTYTISIFAFSGSVLCSLFLFSESKKNTLKLLLTGISLNFFFSAATTLMIFLNRKQLDSILFWTMGSLASLEWGKILIIFTTVLVTILLTYRERNTLDLLLMSEETARSSGIEIEKKKIYLLILSSITTSIIVSFCGVIGFIGMLSSHIIRLILGPKHKTIIIPTILMGSLILVISDLISRTVIAPSELPIGVVSSILGAPLLFTLIRRKNHGFNSY